VKGGLPQSLVLKKKPKKGGRTEKEQKLPKNRESSAKGGEILRGGVWTSPEVCLEQPTTGNGAEEHVNHENGFRETGGLHQKVGEEGRG